MLTHSCAGDILRAKTACFVKLVSQKRNPSHQSWQGNKRGKGGREEEGRERKRKKKRRELGPFGTGNWDSVRARCSC